jgi:hypothetical protein
MKPAAPNEMSTGTFATTPCRGLSVSRQTHERELERVHHYIARGADLRGHWVRRWRHMSHAHCARVVTQHRRECGILCVRRVARRHAVESDFTAGPRRHHFLARYSIRRLLSSAHDDSSDGREDLVAFARDSPNQTMKPTAPLRKKSGVFATPPCRGLSLSR